MSHVWLPLTLGCTRTAAIGIPSQALGYVALTELPDSRRPPRFIRVTHQGAYRSAAGRAVPIREEALVGMLRPGDLFVEGRAGQPLRIWDRDAVVATAIVRIQN